MTKLEQAARALLAHWDTPAWKYIKPTGDLMADLRDTLAEQDSGSVCARCGGIVHDPVIEQAEQEPVAWCYFCEDSLWGFFTDPDECDPDCDNEMPLYASPVRTKDLTDDEVMQTYTNFNLNELGEQSFMIGFARAVIAADREKNK